MLIILLFLLMLFIIINFKYYYKYNILMDYPEKLLEQLQLPPDLFGLKDRQESRGR